MTSEAINSPHLDPAKLATDVHVKRVWTVAEGRPTVASENEIAGSWRRSLNLHHVNPESVEAPRILTTTELKEAREPLAKLIVDARDELDHLYGIVGQADYTVLLCDKRGIAVEHRGNEAEAEHFKHWGTWLGGVWGEEAEGTNGIGTCIAERRPITVHRTQHFRVRNTSLSCSGAPIFDSDGDLLAVLDVSSIDPELSEASHALTGALTEASARAIEERCFRERFRRQWIVAIWTAPKIGPGLLLALDRDHRIVGADRNGRTLLARKALGIEDGVSVWDLFKYNPALFLSRDGDDRAVQLTLAGTAEVRSALVTPPEIAYRNPRLARLHSRPRLHVVGTMPSEGPPRIRGGLPPQALRRVKEYVDANLDQPIGVRTLADVARFSVFHFARAFKQSEGMTPHAFVLGQRVKRAVELLTTTELSLTAVARASGFSDQGHLARQFRRRLGISPSTLRRTPR